MNFLKKVVVSLMAGFVVLLRMPPVAQAVQTPQIRAVFPQPSTGLSEWILVQNRSDATATQSAVISDTHGSVKSHSFVLALDQEWYQFTASVSGITLNNDQDSVTLLVNGVAGEPSEPYQTSIRDQVWTRLEPGWEWLSLSEFVSRWEEEDWSKPATATPSASPTTQQTSSPSTTVKKSPSPSPSSQVKLESSPIVATIAAETAVSPPPTPYLGKKMLLGALNMQESSSSAQAVPIFLEPDYAGEMDAYASWLRWWWRSMWLWCASFVCWSSFIAKDCIQWAQKRGARRWGWSLLS